MIHPSDTAGKVGGVLQPRQEGRSRNPPMGGDLSRSVGGVCVTPGVVGRRRELTHTRRFGYHLSTTQERCRGRWRRTCVS